MNKINLYLTLKISLGKCVMNNYIHIFITIINIKDIMLCELKNCCFFVLFLFCKVNFLP